MKGYFEGNILYFLPETHTKNAREDCPPAKSNHFLLSLVSDSRAERIRRGEGESNCRFSTEVDGLQSDNDFEEKGRKLLCTATCCKLLDRDRSPFSFPDFSGCDPYLSLSKIKLPCLNLIRISLTLSKFASGLPPKTRKLAS